MKLTRITLFLFSLSAFAAPVAVSPANQSVAVGQVFNVNVTISSVTDLYGYQFDLGYDPTAVSVLGVQEGAFLPSGGSTFFSPGTDDGVGSVTFIAGSLFGPSGVTGSGTLVSINLKALASTTTSLNLNSVSLLDSNLNSISATVNDGSVSITTAPAPEPSAFMVVPGILAAFLLRRKHLRV